MNLTCGGTTCLSQNICCELRAFVVVLTLLTTVVVRHSIRIFEITLHVSLCGRMVANGNHVMSPRFYYVFKAVISYYLAYLEVNTFVSTVFMLGARRPDDIGQAGSKPRKCKT